MTLLAKRVQEPEYRMLHRIADDLEPRFRRAFLRAFKTAKQDVTLTAIEAAVTTGSLAAFNQLIPWEDLVQSTAKDLQVVYREGIERAAANTIKHLPVSVTQGVNVTFDVLDPRVVEFMRDRSAQLVTETTASTREALRQSLTRSIERGENPRRAARALRDTIGLTERQARAADNFLARQLQDGNTTVGRAERRAERYRARLLRRRTENIARTEAMRAANSGQQQLWSQLEREGVIDRGEMEREWIVTPDDRLCDECEALDGARAPLDGSFPGADLPPLHPSCRCVVQLVRRRS